MKTNLEEENERLREELKRYKAETTHIQSYFTIKKVIDDINKSMRATDIDWKADEDTVKVERAVEVAESLSKLNDQLEKLEKKINPETLDKAKKENETHTDSILENVLKEGK